MSHSELVLPAKRLFIKQHVENSLHFFLGRHGTLRKTRKSPTITCRSARVLAGVMTLAPYWDNGDDTPRPSAGRLERLAFTPPATVQAWDCPL
jgi:hypothetical protein